MNDLSLPPASVCERMRKVLERQATIMKTNVSVAWRGLHSNQKGMTDLETAIILSAFVTVEMEMNPSLCGM